MPLPLPVTKFSVRMTDRPNVLYCALDSYDIVTSDIWGLKMVQHIVCPIYTK